MNTLNRKNVTYTLDNLPAISSFSFSYNGTIGFTGSIVKRPLLKHSPLYHFAFFYGFDLNGQPLLIENNEDGVECVTWIDFISDAKEFQIVHFEKDQSQYKEIMTRAFERSNEKYILHDNNCEHFVNYCVHDTFDSIQANMGKRIADSLFSFAEIKIASLKGPISSEILKEYDDIRKMLNLERKNVPLQKMIENKNKTP